MGSLPTTAATQVRRHAERQSTDRAERDPLLSQAYVAAVACCAEGTPLVLPMACAPDGERLLLHGSTGSRLVRLASAGAPLAVAVTLLDGLVYARSLFNSSMNYRSLIAYGCAQVLQGAEKLTALRVLSEHLMPGRWAEVRALTTRELAATGVLALPLTESSVKIRRGGPADHDESADPVWAGVLPMHTVAGRPQPATTLPPGTPIPPSVDQVIRLLDRG
ncbi:MAG: pyridoxamine 5'-phosphate oxidase family protein [Actinomycetes bacterium]